MFLVSVECLGLLVRKQQALRSRSYGYEFKTVRTYESVSYHITPHHIKPGKLRRLPLLSFFSSYGFSAALSHPAL